jgi:ferredoxin-nitrite reductase
MGEATRRSVGVEIRGSERPMPFLRPYRSTGRLNDVELAKLERHPLRVAEAVIREYSVSGPDAIAEVPGEAERLKWVGLYPQRQGADAFMLRMKIPGGRLTAAQLREIGLVAEAFAEGPVDSPVFGNRYADLTTRQDIQLHWIRIEDVPSIWRRLAAVGITTVQACGDSARNVLCCPLSGVGVNEVFDASPVALAINEMFTGNREYANLPRKFKLSVTGCREDCVQAEINDVGLWPARLEDGSVGFNALVGGGLSDGERMASDIDVFVRPEQAVELVRAIAQLYGELGNRENRGLARMRYLVQELGPEGFRSELVRRASFPLVPSGVALTVEARGDHVGVQPQVQDGLFAVGCCVPVGRAAGRDLVEVSRVASAYGDGGIRLTTDQNFVLTGVPEDRVDDLLAEDVVRKLSPFPGPFARGVVACTGSEFCRFAVVETKERAVKMAGWLDENLAPGGDRLAADWRNRGDEGPDVVRLHVSGCSASCAQPQIADIGFRGATAHDRDEIVEAFDIGMGGSLGLDAAFGDWIDGGHPASRAHEAVARVFERFKAGRRAGEPFHVWARRMPASELRATLAGVEASGT